MNNSLEHYGVKGMRWGVRRYQNPDGTLTKAGEKRRSKLQIKELKKRSKRVHNKKDLKQLTNYIMSMSLSELELYNKSPMKRASIEKNAIKKAKKYAAAGNEEKAKQLIDRVFFNKPSWDTVEGEQWFREFLEQ